MALGVCDFSVSGFSTHTALGAVSHTQFGGTIPRSALLYLPPVQAALPGS